MKTRLFFFSFNSFARGSCIPDCEPGTYFDSELIKCGECHHTCQTCVGEFIARRGLASIMPDGWNLGH